MSITIRRAGSSGVQALVAALICAVPLAACGDSASTGNGGGGDDQGGSGDQGGSIQPSGTGGSESTSTSSGGGGASCGAVAVQGPQSPNESAACVACVDDSCCAERADCDADADCHALVDCLQTCASALDYACTGACFANNAAGVALEHTMATCRNSSCNEACAATECVGNVMWSPPSSPTLTRTFLFTHLDNVPASNATVRACPRDDVDCTQPIAEGVADGQGRLELELPTSPDGFDAYLEVSGTELVTTLFYLFAADPGATFAASQIQVAIPTPANVTTVAGALGVTLDPTRGSLGLFTMDCVVSPHEGLTVAVSAADDLSTTSYFHGLVPAADETQTDWQGLYVALDVPPGITTVQSTVAATQAPWGSVDVIVRPNALTWFYLTPTP